MGYLGITIALCTRNRPEELYNCILSISKQRGVPDDLSYELLIVDDGNLVDWQLDSYRNILGNIPVHYYKKSNPGLLLSRIEAITRAMYDIVLFIDDDVELDEFYLAGLCALYRNDPNIAGGGGIDVLVRSSWLWRVYTRIFLYNSGNPGKLSLTGYGGSMVYWAWQSKVFETEFFSGCNMSFRKNALQELLAPEWLRSYSLGEDIYLSQIARKHGKIWIDPRLKVKHYQSPVARDKEEQVAYMEIVNHYYLLEMEKGKRWWSCLLQVWTSVGLLIQSYRNSGGLQERRKGYIKGIRFLFDKLFHSASGISGGLMK